MFVRRRKTRARRYATAVALLGIAAAMPGGAAEFVALGLPGAQLAALSADGCIAAGGISDGEHGFRWTVGGDVQRLASAISVRALSASGRYAAGSSLDAERREVATYWDAAGQVHRLGGAPGVDAISVVSQAFGVTDAGQVVGSVGNAAAAFAWTAAGGLRLLDAGGATAARAEGVGDDGAVIYGWSEGVDGRRRGLLWSAGTMRVLPGEDAREVREIAAASRSARVLLGMAADGRGGLSAYRWSAPHGFVVPPPPAPARSVRLLASSEDGRIVVGSAGQGDERRAIVWSEGDGVRFLDLWLAARGVAVPPGWRLGAATAVAADGRRIGGWGLRDGRFDSFVLDLRDGGPASAGCVAKP
jgi:uncharacterized membrane protein